MKKFFAAVAAVAAVVVGGLAVASPASASTERVSAVPPITCNLEDGCELGYVTNSGNGYAMLRQADPVSAWVRVSLVPGWDNSFVAPITCKYYNSCVFDYTAGEGNGGYWRARQASDTAPYTWVRISQYGV